MNIQEFKTETEKVFATVNGVGDREAWSYQAMKAAQQAYSNLMADGSTGLKYVGDNGLMPWLLELPKKYGKQ